MNVSFDPFESLCALRESYLGGVGVGKGIGGEERETPNI
jgi:hypothetical protein